MIAAAVVGGTASKISGGKFANGAVTGAFSRAFNDELHGHKESYWDAFRDKWNERVGQITGAADRAVDYWIERGNPVMGTLAATLTKDNIGNTLGGISLASGVGSTYLFFAGKGGAPLAELALTSGVGADVLSGNEYTWQKLGIEAVSRFTVRFGPVDEIGSRIHSGVNQMSTTFTGTLIGDEQ